MRFDDAEDGIAARIGENLRGLRKQAGVTQSQFAAFMNISVPQYRKYETGQDIPRYHSVCRWSLITGIPAYLLVANTPYVDMLPEKLVSWKLLPFYGPIAQQTDTSFFALLELIRSVCHKSTLLIQPKTDICMDKYSMDEATTELENQLYTSIAQALREFRRIHGYSQEVMAEKLGLSINTYRNYENIEQDKRFSFLLEIRFFACFSKHLTALAPHLIFSQIRKRQINRLVMLAETFITAPLDEYQAYCRLFKSVSHIAGKNDAYIF